jgi:DNA-directed RNA polymerase subunit M/transcription elongation factor TFIIS
MQCPRCKTELPPSERAGTSRRAEESRPNRDRAVTTASEEALRADTPPAPCPQCGWSTMWNE